MCGSDAQAAQGEELSSLRRLVHLLLGSHQQLLAAAGELGQRGLLALCRGTRGHAEAILHRRVAPLGEQELWHAKHTTLQLGATPIHIAAAAYYTRHGRVMMVSHGDA